MLMGVITQHLLSWLDPHLHHLNTYGHKAVDWIFASANFEGGGGNKPQQQWTLPSQIGAV